jgi:hypothetical protein
MVILVVSIFAFILYFLLMALAMVGLRDSDIFSKVPFHGLMKLSITIYRVLDYGEIGFKVFLIIMCVLNLAWMIRRIKKLKFYNEKT